MKKAITIITALMICIFGAMALTGCGTPSPSDTAKTFLDALKAQDTETMASVYAGKDLDVENGLFGESDEEDTLLSGESFDKMLMEKILDFDYAITNEKIDGDKATVTVDVTTYPMGDTFSQIYADMMTQIWGLAFSDASDEQTNAVIEGIFTKHWQEMTEKTYKGTADLSLTKTEDGWKVDEIEDDSDFLNVLTGNMVKVIEALDEEE